MGFWVIGTYKLVKAFLLLAAGFFFLYLARAGVSSGLEHVVAWLRINPADHCVRMAASWLDGMDRRHLNGIGLAIILYGLLYVAQSVGLLLRRRWGAYLVIVSTGFLIPVEAYETVQRVTPMRLGVLVLNVGIVLYLVEKLRQDQKHRAGCVGEPTVLRS